MPNTYVKKKSPKYTEDDINNAVVDVQTNMLSIYAAAKKYGIPTTTLYDKIKNTYNTNVVGRRLAIPWEIENRLADAIKTMEKWGFGLSREEVLSLVEEFVKRNNVDTPFTNNKPGKDWFINFKKRHRLSIKKAQPVEYVRKKMTDPFVISDYFKLLEDTLTVLHLTESPHLIWNMDETSLSLDPTRTKVVGAINKPCSRTTCGTGKENITVLTTVSAAGQKISPLIVFKGKNVWDQWMASTENYDFELSYAASSKGWMKTEIFYNYVEKILIPALGRERPALIIYDGHSTHVDTNVIELARKNCVTILKLPPHTSHLLQPLDVAVFKSFKTKWDGKLVEWQRHNVGTKMPKNIFAQTFAETWQETNPDVIKSGFKKAGIYPFDSKVIPEDKYDPAAYRRYKEAKNVESSRSQKQLSSKSLKALCVELINKVFNAAEEITTKEVSYFTALSRTDNQTQSFVAKSKSLLPECLQNHHSPPKAKKEPKINILSDIKINFEELLLEKLRQDKKQNIQTKKKRVARGAEVITIASINKTKEEEKVKKREEKIRKATERAQKEKTKIQTQSKRKSSLAKNHIKGKKNPKISSSSTSLSDIMSIYSDMEVDYCDYEILSDNFWDEPDLDAQLEEQELKEQEAKHNSYSKYEIMKNTSNDKQIFAEEDRNSPNKKKGKGKKTKTGKENNLLKECEIQKNVKTNIVIRKNDETKAKRKPKEGNFIIVEFEVKGKKIYYVAKVMGEKSNEIEVNFLRKSLKTANTFYMPNVPDIATVALQDIKMILPAPKFSGNTKRKLSLYHFDVDFSNLDLR